MALAQRTSVHMHSKGFHRHVVLMTRATQKEQATTSLKTNFLNINHVESNKTSRRFYKETEKWKHAETSASKRAYSLLSSVALTACGLFSSFAVP